MESLVKKLMAMSDEELEKETPKIIGSYPNTYTFTKSNAERLLF